MGNYPAGEGYNPKEALRRIEDDTELYLELIQMYLEDAPVLLNEMIPAIRNKVTEVASLRTHSLKSTSRTVGAMGLGEVASDAEQAVIRKDWNRAEALLPEIKKQFEHIQTIFARIISEPDEGLKFYCE
jgi:HPt (histidine-containing phosphotransfer) domain-containing protein